MAEVSAQNSDDVDQEKLSIRAELATMSFEDLQKLKETLGSKVYNEAMFGKSSTREMSYKRANKNRPREVSSKRPVTFDNVIAVKKHVIRDPRFDSLCGSYNPKEFKKSYGFINEIRTREKEYLKDEVKNVKDPKKKEKLKLLIQRIENQEREERRRKDKEDAMEREKEENLRLLREGHKPHFKTKRERKIENLLSKYSELKESGKLVKHIEKQRRKLKKKEKNKLKTEK